MAQRMEAERSRSAALGDLLERRSWLVYVVLALMAFPMQAERPGALVLADTFAAGW
jgi:hypothetical protein